MTDIETRVEHYYQAYGMMINGYGSSMDPHRCGDPNEPCVIVRYEREVSPWKQVYKKVIDEHNR